MTLMTRTTFKDAFEITEEIYPQQLKKLKNCTTHPFLEQTVSQRAQLFKMLNRLEDAEQSYKLLVSIKDLYYGEYSESLITALKNLGAVQYVANKIDESIATLEKALEVVRRIQNANKIRDQNYFKGNSTEVIILLLSVMERQFGTPIDYNKLNQIEETLIKIQQTDKNQIIAQFHMLKAKKMQMTQGTDPELVLATITKAITIQRDIDDEMMTPSVQLGRFMYFQGTVYMSMHKPKETLKCFKESRNILSAIPEYAELVQELQFHIDNITS